MIKEFKSATECIAFFSNKMEDYSKTKDSLRQAREIAKQNAEEAERRKQMLNEIIRDSSTNKTPRNSTALS